jgi:non-ribosomal peptide synthase protein (TIGR01720 family)
MVPAAFVVLERLPLNANGKVDRAALPAPRIAPAGGRQPGTPRERLLRDLVAEVLGAEPATVGVDDDFFGLGGDSILSIQLVSRARKAGLAITAQQVFQHPTVEALAAVAGEPHEQPPPEPGAGTGPLPMTPVMSWLREVPGPVAGFNQSALLRAPAGLTVRTLSALLDTLIEHHGALRLRATGDWRSGPAGDWRLRIEPTAATRPGDLVTRVDVAGLGPAEWTRVVRERAEAARSRLSPAGPVLQAVWFDPGPAAAGTVLLVLHHLVVDGVSWRILLADLRAAWADVSAGRTPRLDPVPTSFRRWAQGLAAAAVAPSRVAELPVWREVLAGTRPPLGSRPLDPARDIAGTARSVTVQLPAGPTAALLGAVPAAYHADITEILLTALALAILDGRGPSGDPGPVLVELERHGREPVVPGADLSRTVGWFTCAHPVRLEPGPVDWPEIWAGGPALGRVVKLIKEQVRALPDHGIGYGLLRYLNPDTAPVLAELAAPEISFNYLGRFDADGTRAPARADPQPAWTPRDDVEPVLDAREEGMRLRHALSVDAVVAAGPDGPSLGAVWTWPDGMFTEARVRGLGDAWVRALRALVWHVEATGGGGYSPSDIDLLSLTQNEIDELELEWRHAQ